MEPTSSTAHSPPVVPSGRRSFLGWLAALFGVIAASLVAVPFVGYLFGTRKRAVDWVDLGPVHDFPVNATRMVTFDNPLRQPWDGMVAHTGVYVRNQGADGGPDAQFLILAVNCAHLGCPVTWFPESGLFMCPCHGGVYYSDGTRASGPPPRGLFEYHYKVENGELFVKGGEMPTLANPV